MIASRNLAAVAFAGGATLALLAGCAQAPSTYSPPESSLYYDPGLAAAQMQRDYSQQLNAWAAEQQRAYTEQLNAERQSYIEQLDGWRQQQQSQTQRRGRRRYANNPPGSDDGPVISDNPPTPAPVPQTSNRPECSGWWRLCHFL
jgi:hypothetical protein